MQPTAAAPSSTPPVPHPSLSPESTTAPAPGTAAAASTADPPPVNRLSILVKYLVAPPAAFTGYGLDQKGMPSTAADDHIFTYSLSLDLGIPPKKSDAPADGNHLAPPAPARPEK
eukprot:RCo036771